MGSRAGALAGCGAEPCEENFAKDCRGPTELWSVLVPPVRVGETIEGSRLREGVEDVECRAL